MYGWYGYFGSRDNNGELSQDPPPVQYVQYDEDVFAMVAESNIFNPLTFRVNFMPTRETTEPLETEAPTEAAGPSMVVIVSVAVGGGLAALVIVLIIVLVCVFGRKKDKDKPKKKKRRR